MAEDTDTHSAESTEAPKSRRRPAPRSPTFEIQVTQEHIDDSIRRSSSHCMVTEAIKSAFPGMSGVTTDLQSIRMTDPVKRLRYVYFSPRIVQVNLIQYDRGIAPEPFFFRLKRASQIHAVKNRVTNTKTALLESNGAP